MYSLVRSFFFSTISVAALGAVLLSTVAQAHPVNDPNKAIWAKVIWYPSNNAKEKKHCDQVMISDDKAGEQLKETLRTLAQRSCVTLGESRCPRGEASILLMGLGTCPDTL